MSSLYIIRGPLCRPLLARPPCILKRNKFTGRTKKITDTLKPSALPKHPARTRFAPSPTGYVHIGSLRTALYNYLLAKATGGQFLLRIEDTDQTRIVPDAEKRLYEDLKWAGLSWDEGPDVGGSYGPYKQSERLALYNKYADQLLNDGQAYRCFCNPKDLDHMKSINIQQGRQIAYNGTCSHIPPHVSARRAAEGEEHCVRFKSDNSSPTVNDLVYGHYKSTSEDDFIIIKRDGYPTYHFANVIDDHLMEITHVIRGAEWLISTPKHVALYKALKWQHPTFAHVGLLVDQNKQKLSKRHGDVDIASWRDRGILPIALLNYVMLLGWSLRYVDGVKGQDLMDLDEMVKKFDFNFTKGNIAVNNKHEFLQKEHIKRITQSLGLDGLSDIILPPLVALVKKHEEERIKQEQNPEDTTTQVRQLGPLVPRARARPSHDGYSSPDGVISPKHIENLLKEGIEHYRTAEQFLDRNWFLIWQIPDAVYRSTLEAELSSLPKDHYFSITNSYGTIHVHDLVARLQILLLDISDQQWTETHIHTATATFSTWLHCIPADTPGVEKGGRAWGYPFMRWILAASTPGPSVIPTMLLLGREETMRRVRKAYEIAKDYHEKREAKGETTFKVATMPDDPNQVDHFN